MIRCLETRTLSNGWRRRRYKTEEGTRFTTLEVPFELGSAISRVEAIAAAKGMSIKEWLTKVENGLKRGEEFTPPSRAKSPPRTHRRRS